MNRPQVTMEKPSQARPSSKSKRHHVAIVMPAYNEAETIGGTIAEFRKVAPDALICVVDNNSTDRTREIAEKTFKESRGPWRVILEGRQGKGAAIRRAFHNIDANIYVMVDADLTYPAEAMPEMIAIMEQGEVDMVVGDRISSGAYSQENKRTFHGLGNRLVTWLINKLYAAKIWDVMSGYRVMSRRFVKNFPIMRDGFQLETEMTLHALDKRLMLIEVQVAYRNRPAGSSSKLSTIRDGMRVLLTILQIFRYFKPLVFFGFLSIVFALMGIAVGIPVIREYLVYNYVYAVPSAILAAGLTIVSLILFSIGIILDSVAAFHKIQYEQSILNSMD